MVDRPAEIWTVYAYDLNTNVLITELPAEDLEFSSRLNGAGSISFNLAIGTPKVAKLVEPILLYEGRPFAVYVDLNGVIVWGGIAWTGSYTLKSDALAITGSEFYSYFEQRIIVADYTEVQYPSGVDPAVLLYQVYTDAQNVILAGAGSNIGITVVNSSSGLPSITAGYPLSQYTVVAQVSTDLINVSAPGIGGLDIQITSQWVGGIPVNKLTLWTPRVGTAATASGLSFDLTNVIDFSWDTDATKSATTIIATGAGNGADMPVQQTNAPGVPVGGLGQSPRLDRVFSTSAQGQDQIALMANGLAAQFGKPVTTPTVTLSTNDETNPLGSWIVGDDGRLFLPPNNTGDQGQQGNPRFPNGLNEYWRVVQNEVTVPKEGIATVVITFNQPPIY